jgi:peptidoglycan/xylan/chitin deacetylase (PgdA/CDA1 family)
MAAPAAAPTMTSRVKVRVAEALPRSVIVRRGAGTQKRVALTFDDGPDEMTDAYLDILDNFGARATFFVLGKACAKYQDAVARIAARGHELAGHGFTHKSFTKLDAGALRDELQRTSSLMVTARAGYTTVLWSRDSDDCRTQNAAEVAARVAPASLTPGEIVLLHEGQSWTLDALPEILGKLAAEGWRTVSVGEMLGAA